VKHADHPVARVAGIALIALGIACLLGLALLGMSTSGARATTYLAYLGIRDEWAEPLLWPTVVRVQALPIVTGGQ
jgi:hypothetical protein